MAAVPLAYILPSIAYMKLDPSGWRTRPKMLALFLAFFGIFVTVCGIVMIIVHWRPDSSCSHGKELDYCQQNRLNSSVLVKPF